jgi:RND family efflux transporter MFP subunit
MAVVVALLLGLGAVAAAAKPLNLETATAELRVVPREYRVDGLVEAVHRATVSAQIMGQVERIYYDVDDRVEQGDLLLKLRDSELRSRYSQSAAELHSANAHLEQMQEEFERIAGIYDKQLASESALDKAQADLKGARARYDAAVGALEEAAEQLRYTEIRAPRAGLVTERLVEEGEIVNPGQPLMGGISLHQLKIMIDVPQSIVPTLREQPKLHVTTPAGDELEVRDITVYPEADSDSSSFRVRANLPAGTRELFPGMFVKVAFTVGHKQVLVIPSTAVVKRSEVTGVYVVGDDERVRFRQIRVGRQLDADVEVLAGLSPGERTAVDPLDALAALKRAELAPPQP